MAQGVDELAPTSDASGVVLGEKRFDCRSILGPARSNLHGVNCGTDAA